MLNQQWLATFVVLARSGSFTKTAELCFMTQPGVSQHLKKLEQQLGEPLIERFGKRFELTHAGLALLEYGERLQRQEAELMQQLQSDDEYRGVCRFACSGALATDLYPAFLQRQQQHPQLVVYVEAAPNHAIVDAVLNDTVDVGIVTRRSQSPYLQETPLAEDGLALVVPRAVLKRRKRPLAFTELQQLGFIDHPDGEHYAQQLLSVNYVDEFRGISSLPISGYVNQLSQILLPVSRGLGFTVLPTRVVNTLGSGQALVIAPTETQVTESLYLIHKKYRELPKRFGWFIEEIKRRVGG
ncbi:MAG: LysR family transcriptional regulator [Chromatiales bacterium]|nr:LysR family transcriptional regulator [Chromatiales bacterium]